MGRIHVLFFDCGDVGLTGGIDSHGLRFATCTSTKGTRHDQEGVRDVGGEREAGVRCREEVAVTSLLLFAGGFR